MNPHSQLNYHMWWGLGFVVALAIQVMYDQFSLRYSRTQMHNGQLTNSAETKNNITTYQSWIPTPSKKNGPNPPVQKINFSSWGVSLYQKLLSQSRHIGVIYVSKAKVLIYPYLLTETNIDVGILLYIILLNRNSICPLGVCVCVFVDVCMFVE